MCVCLRVCACVRARRCVHACVVHTYVHVCMFTCVHACVCSRVCMYVLACVCTHVRASVCMWVYALMCMYTCACVCASMCQCVYGGQRITSGGQFSPFYHVFPGSSGSPENIFTYQAILPAVSHIVHKDAEQHGKLSFA